ncbi:hypothetical protein B0H63DRAFT_3297 [Podospora didyma]|uniref:Uncharacterized protein n=1 Tax=Podospora didyma TaxID=330526 RepID=A0AAE0P471_9PEZI|nr:hypothetical protein B0H63DRAFT_3297 [Podospora didyma]
MTARLRQDRKDKQRKVRLPLLLNLLRLSATAASPRPKFKKKPKKPRERTGTRTSSIRLVMVGLPAALLKTGPGLKVAIASYLCVVPNAKKEACLRLSHPHHHTKVLFVRPIPSTAWYGGGPGIGGMDSRHNNLPDGWTSHDLTRETCGMRCTGQSRLAASAGKSKVPISTCLHPSVRPPADPRCEVWLSAGGSPPIALD